jgi:hypothetical protein
MDARSARPARRGAAAPCASTECGPSTGERGRSCAHSEAPPDDALVDPPTQEQAVYITSSLEYATWYAARSGGDLYRVVPIGDVRLSEEDHFPTWLTDRARVAEVVKRGVRLNPAQREKIEALWAEADNRAMEILR